MKRGKSKGSFKVLLACLIISYFVAFLGSTVTDTGAWYESVKPSITPPSYVFSVVWTILFFLIALSMYFSWINAQKGQRREVIAVFGLNLFFNFMWSVLYFGMQSPLIAFIDIIILWVSIIMMMRTTWKIDKKASYLLIPYFLWVSFAIVLNYLSI